MYIRKLIKSRLLNFIVPVFTMIVILSKSIVVEATTTLGGKFDDDQSVFFKQSTFCDSGLIALFVVFAIVWAGFFIYVFYMSRKSQDLRNEIEFLKSKVEDTTSYNST